MKGHTGKMSLIFYGSNIVGAVCICETTLHANDFITYFHRGCQIFLGTKYQNGEKYTK
jgi:hypothetical protein